MELTERAEDPVERLSFVFERLVRRLRTSSANDGFSPSFVSVLSALETEGPLRITELARILAVTQPAMTQIVDRMGADGLLRRAPSTTDRRAVEVHLTEAGSAAVRARRERRVENLHALLATLDDADRAVIEAAVPALERLVVA